MVSAPVDGPVKLESHVTADEAAYLRKVLAVRQQAESIYAHYAQHLAEKYGLSQGDSVSEADGKITRSVAPAG